MSREHALLTAALRLPQIPWVFNFFFNTQPHVHLSMFTTSVRPTPPFTLRTRVRTYATNAQTAALFNSDSTLNMLHLPVFTKDDITVGYAVAHCVHSTNIGLAATSPTYHPFARDNKHVVYFAVRQYPHAGYVEIDCVDFSCAIIREKVTMRFQYEAFHASLDFQAERLLVENARRALIFLLETKDDRECVVCCTVRCTCVSKKIMLRSPRNPSDVSNEAYNFLQGLGSSRGQANFTLFKSGSPTFSARLIHDLILEADADNQLKHTLVKCAVSKLMDCARIHPAATSIMDSSSTATAESSAPNSTKRMRTSEVQKPLLGGQVGCSIDTIAIQPSALIDASCGFGARRSRNISLCRYYNPSIHSAHANRGAAVDYMNHWCVNCVTRENFPEQSSHSSLHGPEQLNRIAIHDTQHCSERAFPDEACGTAVDTPTELGADARDMATSGDSAVTTEEQRDKQHAAAKLKEEVCTVSDKALDRETREEQAAPVVDEQNERQRKSLARREKNREAARKSNAKKAAYLRNLRLDLGEASRKKNELMSQLDSLTEENIQLRERVKMTNQ